jgi:PAS domain S-box-containing protein
VETHFDAALRRKDGRRVDIEVAFKILEADDRFRSVVIVRDVTGRKLAEARLREAEERHRTLVENIAAVTYIQEIAEPGSGRTGPTMYASPQIEAQSGCPPEAFVEDPELWIKLLHPADRERVLAEDERTDETGETFSMEYRQIARDGRTVWIRDEAVLVRDEDGRSRFWQGVMYDITERKTAEEQLAYHAHLLENLQTRSSPQTSGSSLRPGTKAQKRCSAGGPTRCWAAMLERFPLWSLPRSDGPRFSGNWQTPGSSAPN